MHVWRWRLHGGFCWIHQSPLVTVAFADGQGSLGRRSPSAGFELGGLRLFLAPFGLSLGFGFWLGGSGLWVGADSLTPASLSFSLGHRPYGDLACRLRLFTWFSKGRSYRRHVTSIHNYFFNLSFVPFRLYYTDIKIIIKKIVSW